MRLFERAHNHQCQIALISGEAGIGKSRLVRELRARLPPDAEHARQIAMAIGWQHAEEETICMPAMA